MKRLSFAFAILIALAALCGGCSFVEKPSEPVSSRVVPAVSKYVPSSAVQVESAVSSVETETPPSQPARESANSAITSSVPESAPGESATPSQESRASDISVSSETASVSSDLTESSEESPAVPSTQSVLSAPSQVPSAPSESSQPVEVSEPTDSENAEMRGVWISFYELADISDESEYKKRIDTMFDNIASIGLNAIFFHVRPSGDALYPSEIFPYSHIIGFYTPDGKRAQGVAPDYDPLEYALTAAHSRGLELHAWLNPYRVWTSSANISELAENNPARIWLTDDNPDNDGNVVVFNNKLYYNPASKDVSSLIVAGVAEIIENYDIDGIHFDDYFYPTTSADFDAASYSSYKNLGGMLSLDDWRRENISKMVSAVWTEVHKKSGVIFGISPAGNMPRVVGEEYADVLLWCSQAGYIDYICPQIYFGYRHATLPFLQTASDWLEIVDSDSVDIYIGLPAYKLGATDSGAGDGKNEFKTDSGIISSMISDSRSLGTDGFVIYSYSALADSDNSKEIAAVTQLLKD